MRQNGNIEPIKGYKYRAQVKIITAFGLSDLEEEVNEWLVEHANEIDETRPERIKMEMMHHIFGTSHQYIMTIMYRAKMEL